MLCGDVQVFRCKKVTKYLTKKVLTKFGVHVVKPGGMDPNH